MTELLLDTNVLVALWWKGHEFHKHATEWFASQRQPRWATCLLTECGFVRLASNPSFSPDCLTPKAALDVLNTNVLRSGHSFWQDHESLKLVAQELSPRLQGHRQVTDAYLLALAIYHKGRLATFDRGIPLLLPRDRRTFVEVIPTATH